MLITVLPRCFAPPQGRGGIEARNFSQFPAISHDFPEFFHHCFLLVPVACVLVPYVSPEQRCCSLRLWEVWLRHRNFPQLFRNFPAIFPHFFAIAFDAP